MSKTAIHENGMSMRLCDICNTYPKFRDQFLALFIKDFSKSHKKVEYMWFSGNYKTITPSKKTFGMPDITFRFTDGDFFFIEVKTKFSTKVQDNQESENEDEGYIGLIEYLGQKVNESYAFLVDQYHPGFGKEQKKIGENGKYTVPIVKWNEVVKCIKKYIKYSKPPIDEQSRLRLFVKDIKENVDGFKNKEDFTSVLKDKTPFLYSPSDFYKCLCNFENLQNLEFQAIPSLKIQNGLGIWVEFTFTIQKAKIELPSFGWYIDVTKAQCDTELQEYSRWVWVGFAPYLLNKSNIVYPDPEKIDPNRFLFSIAIYGDLLSRKKLDDKLVFCKDISNFYYFPLEGQYSNILENINNENYEGVIKNIFENNIMNKVKNIFKNYLPNDTRRINKVWEFDL